MGAGLSRELIALRVTQELKDGDYVNLGTGLPTLVCNFIPQDKDILLHTENGVLGYGPIAREEEIDPDLVNAGGQPVTLKPGASFFHHADSFAMLRGGHVNVCVIGAFQVSEQGDLANWRMPEESVVGSVGGAMDTVTNAKRVIVAMQHTDATGAPKIVKRCTYPLTAKRVVKTIVSNLAFIEVTPEGLLLEEVAPGVRPDEVQAVTGVQLILSPHLREMTF